VPGCSGFQPGPGAYRNLGIKRLFQISIEPFLRIELRAVTGQTEQLDLVFTRINPGLERLLRGESPTLEVVASTARSRLECRCPAFKQAVIVAFTVYQPGPPCSTIRVTGIPLRSMLSAQVRGQGMNETVVPMIA